jgi:hypothetical protein
MRLVGISVVFLSCLLATASGQQGKPDFSGKWQTADSSGKAVTLAIEQKAGAIHVVRTSGSDGKQSVFEFNCTTDGKDCDAAGTKVSLWYDGTSLVEMDISEAAVSTTKLTLDTPTSISVLVTYMTPKADKENFVLRKM